jgi:hypothetical protein
MKEAHQVLMKNQTDQNLLQEISTINWYLQFLSCYFFSKPHNFEETIKKKEWRNDMNEVKISIEKIWELVDELVDLKNNN